MNNPATKMPKLLEKRPEPPELEHILEDLQGANPDDVAFNFFSTYSKQYEGELHQTGALLEGKSVRETSPKRDAAKDSTGVLTEAEACYQKVTSLLDSYQYLKNTQASLGERCSELEEVGQKVQEQISGLKIHLSNTGS